MPGPYHGKNGVVKVGANAIALVTEFTVVETVDTADSTAMLDPAQTHLTGIPAWSANITCRFDESDADGQEALTIGASVSLELLPSGDTSGLKSLTGTASVVNIEIPSAMADVVNRTFDCTGNGALVHGTVGP